MDNNDTTAIGRNIYMPLNERLIEFAKDSTTNPDIHKVDFKLYVFTFVDSDEDCSVCSDTINALIHWFTKYDLLKPSMGIASWIIDEHMTTNAICDDIGMVASPTTLFCDSHGNIMDIILGSPGEKWLEKWANRHTT